MNSTPWWRRPFRKRDRRMPNQTTAEPGLPALREFVYLDEVSLRSLLSSQTGGMTDSTSEQTIAGSEAAISGSASANPGFVAKAEVTSRYQTTNSSTIQTSRKATVQSWFRELHEISGLRIIEPTLVDGPVEDLLSLVQIKSLSQLAPSDALRRGNLVELRVKLAADPIFHLGTMVSEFTAMAEDYPEMLDAGNGLATLNEVQPINKILQRLLAGLVPVRALAVDYVVVEIQGTEYIAHQKLVQGLDLVTRPLEVVGVTEQEAYWKDLRRVLFSDAEFTVLARISRTGLQESWTPVKLADLFADIAPTLVDQINAAGRLPLGGAVQVSAESAIEAKLGSALSHYEDALLLELGKTLDAAGEQATASRVEALKVRAATVSDQTTAFAQLTKLVLDLVGGEIKPGRALELRTDAREACGLSLFPSAGPVLQAIQAMPTHASETDPRLLDVDIVAIYW